MESDKMPFKRPKILKGTTRKVNLACGKMYIIINRTDDGKIKEVFVRLGKSGSCFQTTTGVITFLLTRMLRKGISPEELADCLTGFRCSVNDLNYTSCMDAIGKELLKECKGE